MVGISNATANFTTADFNSLANITNPTDFLVNVNHQIFEGYLYFILLWVLWVILYMVMREVDSLKGRPLVNIMYGGAAVTMISLFLRVITVSRSGIVQGLLSDNQMWIFPILTILIASLVWGLNRS